MSAHALELPPDRPVLTRAEARVTFGERVVRRELAARRWTTTPGGLVVQHNGALSSVEREWVALLAAPPGSALGGLTAAAHEGLRVPRQVRVDQEDVHVVLPRGRRRPPVPWVVPHWSGFLGAHDVAPSDVPRRTRPGRSVVDAAAWLEDGEAARVVVLASAQQRVATPGQLALALRTRGPCRHHALLLEAIADAAGGADSVPEAEFARIVSAAGLPAPQRQRVVKRPDRRGRYYLDADWPQFGVAAEVEGVHHFEAAQREADLDRLLDLVIERGRVLLLTSHAVRHRPVRVADALRRALVKGGWRG